MLLVGIDVRLGVQWLVSGCFDPFALYEVDRRILSGSRSASAVRGQRSLSVARNSTDTALSLPVTCCAHRRHVRLANLRTLVLANNILEYVQLTSVSPATTPSVLSHRDRRSSTASNASSRRSSSMARKSMSEYPASLQSSPTVSFLSFMWLYHQLASLSCYRLVKPLYFRIYRCWIYRRIRYDSFHRIFQSSAGCQF